MEDVMSMKTISVQEYKPFVPTKQKLGHKVINEYALVKLEKEKEFKPIFQPLKAAKRLSGIPIYAFDTENFGPNNSFSCASIVGPGGYSFFTADFGEFVSEVDRLCGKHSRKWLLLSHNLGYDLSVLDYDRQSWLRHKTNMKKLITATKDKCSMVDTCNIIPGSVAEMGESIGIPKLGDDHKLLKLVGGLSWSELSDELKMQVKEYNMRDAEIVLKGYDIRRQAIFRMFKVDLTECYTTPSASMRIFRTGFLGKTTDGLSMEDKLIQRGNLVNDYERHAYFGGRVECFDLAYHKSTIYEDINSSFPTRMLALDFPHPCKFVDFKEGETYETLKSDFPVFMVKALVDIPAQFVGPLPLRVVEQKDGSFVAWENPLNGLPNRETGTIYPTGGKIVGWWWSNELNNAVDRYGVKVLKIIEGRGYPQMLGRIFKDFIKTLSDEKNRAGAEGRPVDRQIAKLTMNSTYGKFSQSVIQTYSALQNTHDELDAVKRLAGRKGASEKVDIDENGRAFRVVSVREPDPLHVFPVWSGLITAESRIALLNERLCKNGVGNVRVLYCDTDSALYSGDRIMENIGDELGNWSLKDSGKSARVFCKKGYVYDGVLKMKGVFPSKPDAESLERMKELTSLLENGIYKDADGNPLSFLRKRPLKENEASRRGMKASVWIEVDKVITTSMKGRHSDPATGKTWTISCDEVDSGVEYYEDKQRKQSIAPRLERNLASVVKRQHAEAPREAGKRETLQETIKARA